MGRECVALRRIDDIGTIAKRALRKAASLNGLSLENDRELYETLDGRRHTIAEVFCFESGLHLEYDSDCLAEASLAPVVELLEKYRFT